MATIYVIYRQRGNKGKKWYLSRDTARTFWWPKFDEKWIKFFLTEGDAQRALEQAQGSGIPARYGIITREWSRKKIEKRIHPPLDGLPLKESNY